MKMISESDPLSGCVGNGFNRDTELKDSEGE
jgi:hypothetical protein